MAGYEYILKMIKNNKFACLPKEIQVFLNQLSKGTHDCKCVCNILSSFANVASNLSVFNEFGESHIKPCVTICLDYLQKFTATTLKDCYFHLSLYYIIIGFTKNELDFTALTFAQDLKKFFSHPDSSDKNKSSVIKNVFISLWNAAIKYDNCDPEMAFQLRAIAIEFIMLDEFSVSSISQKICSTLSCYCKSDRRDVTRIQDFLQNSWQKISNSDSGYAHAAALFKIICSWDYIFVFKLKETSIFYKLIDWLSDIPNHAGANSKLQGTLNVCIDIVKYFVQIFVFKNTSLPGKTVKMWKSKLDKNHDKINTEVVAHTYQFFYAHLSDQYCINKNYAAWEFDNFSLQVEPHLDACAFFAKQYLSMNEEAGNAISISIQCHLTVCRAFLNLFRCFIEAIKDDENQSNVLRRTKKFVKFSIRELKQIADNKIDNETSQLLIIYGTMIGNLGIICYNNFSYDDACNFLEDSITLATHVLLYHHEPKESVRLWKRHELLVTNYYLLGRHNKALQAIVECLVAYKSNTKECMDLWKKVKRDILRNGMKQESALTISDVLKQLAISVDPENEASFLIEELKCCKMERCDVTDELIAITCKLLSMPCSSTIRAYVLVAVAAMPLAMSENIALLIKKSVSEMIQEAVDLYTEHLKENPCAVTKLQLSVAHFWCYYKKLKRLHDITMKEVEEATNPDPVVQNENIPINDVDDENDVCDIKPAFPLVTLLVELESTSSLRSAFQLWTEISESPDCSWSDLASTVEDLNLLDIMHAAAEIFATSVHDLYELKLWLLLREVSTATESKQHKLIACTGLINACTRLGYLKFAKFLIEDMETKLFCQTDDFFSTVQKLNFQLAMSHCYLKEEKLDDGLKLLKEIIDNPLLQKNVKSTQLLLADAKLLLSKYLSISIDAFLERENITCLWSTTTPLVLVAEATDIYIVLFKHQCLPENLNSDVLRGGWIYYTPILIRGFIKSHLDLGKIFTQIGAPREARCYLQEALKISQANILTYWTSKILALLGHIDLLCDNSKDCLVKLNGLKYIMNKDSKESILKLLCEVCHENEMELPDDTFITNKMELPAEKQIRQNYVKDSIDIQLSPVIHRTKKSTFVLNNHPNSCNCQCCEIYSSQLVCLEITSVYCLYLFSQASLNSAAKEFEKVLHSYDSLKQRLKFGKILSALNNNTDLTYKYSSDDVDFLIFVSTQLSLIYSISGCMEKAETFIKLASDLLGKASKQAKYIYPDLYASVTYHKINNSLKKQASINGKVEFYLCPISTYDSPMLKNPNINAMQGFCALTPTKSCPKICISSHSMNSNEACNAPVKKDVLPSDIKKNRYDAYSTNSSTFLAAQSLIFSSSEEENAFESPLPTRKCKKKVQQAVNVDENKDYKFFKTKNTTSVNSASDVWGMTLKPPVSAPVTSLTLAPKKSRASKSDSSYRKKTSSSKLKPKNSKVPRSDSKRKESPRNSFSQNMSVTCVPVEKSRTCSEQDTESSHGFSGPAEHLRNAGEASKLSLPKSSLESVIEDLSADIERMNVGRSIQGPQSGVSIPVDALKEYLKELHEALQLIENNPPFPLYVDICTLLALLKYTQSTENFEREKLEHFGYLLSETFSVTLRHLFTKQLLSKAAIPDSFKKLSELREVQLPLSTRMENMLNAIPDKWTVVQVNAIYEKDLYSNAVNSLIPKLVICQFRNNSLPVISCVDNPVDEKFTTSFYPELEDILKMSRLLMMDKNDARKWWKATYALDKRMNELAESMENVWLGFWKALFLGLPISKRRVRQIEKMSETINKIAEPTDKMLAQAIIDAAPLLSKKQLSAAVSILWNCTSADAIHEKLMCLIKSSNLPETERQHLVLILDKDIQALPWESMPVMSGNSISRVPSLSLMKTALSSYKRNSILNDGVDTNNTFYILNPSADLVYSQQQFQNKFEEQINWNGIVGRAPTSKEFISAFEDHEVFIYLGHGSGQAYFEGASISKLQCKAVTVLMGCSSGRLKLLGRKFEPYGNVYRYWLNGCPCVLANLWDVTDKDIDRFTVSMLELWLPGYGKNFTVNISRATSKARKSCKMPFLVGAAPVVYGFPVSAKVTSHKCLDELIVLDK